MRGGGGGGRRKSASQVRAKNGAVLFNCQYFINRLMFDFDF